MMRSSQLTETVTNVVQRTKMKFEARAIDDIVQALNTFKDLRPSFTYHQFSDGISRWCVSLSGTIPINYKGSTYHIPIALFLMDNHPYSGPYCYVCPTSTMRIRVSETVDEKGRIYLPYLTEWRYPGYDTCGLLQVMTIAFQERSPMYSISATSAKPTPPMNVTSTPYPAPNIPYPVGQNPTPYPTTILHPMPPSSTPYPNLQNPTQQQYPGMGNGYQPPYQPYVNYPSASSASATNNGLDSTKPTSSVIPSSGSDIPYGYGTIQSNHIHASLISAVEDKIRNRLREKIGNPFAELQSIDINLQELRTGQQKLRDMLEKISVDQTQLEVITEAYKEKKLELEKALQACQANESRKGDDPIDDVIDTTTPLHRQIFRCYAQDCAIDDTIYVLGQALKKGVINIQTYLKYVRQLSRKQFVYRATLQKCRLKAKLPI